MREHYSTVRVDEKRAVMERVGQKLVEAKEKSEKKVQVERATGLEPATACLGTAREGSGGVSDVVISDI
jgi:hypothetical protein